mmetsp:Transcript_44235/g.69170  ORF Transcript_44235/g.69170 Transcript_44235/m.69170 type:complete len:135 (-) Transcript_44235:238-642(-)
MRRGEGAGTPRSSQKSSPCTRLGGSPAHPCTCIPPALRAAVRQKRELSQERARKQSSERRLGEGKDPKQGKGTKAGADPGATLGGGFEVLTRALSIKNSLGAVDALGRDAGTPAVFLARYRAHPILAVARAISS